MRKGSVDRAATRLAGIFMLAVATVLGRRDIRKGHGVALVVHVDSVSEPIVGKAVQRGSVLVRGEDATDRHAQHDVGHVVEYPAAIGEPGGIATYQPQAAGAGISGGGDSHVEP